MKNETSVKKNIGYQTLYHVLVTILPLITAPYLARTLGVTKQGIYSYTASIVNYFTLFAMLGIANHGTRCIALYKDKKESLNKKFSSIFFIQFISSFVTLVFYFLYLFFICSENIDISIIQIISIFSCFFDINWLFLGLEDFKFVVVRNSVIRILVVIFIVIFVNKPDDLWIYTFLMVGSTFLSNIVLWFKYSKYVRFVLPSKNDIIKELKPIFILFIPLLAMSVYHIMDKTMLGLFSDYDNVGFYYNADKVINIPIGIVTGISSVLFPRSVIYLKKSKTAFESFFKKGLEGTIVVSIALSFGIASISNEFTPIFFGKGFEKCIMLIIVLSPVMIIKSISSIMRFQYLIPKKKEKYFIYSVLLGAIVNFIANYFLISKYGAFGAVIGTLIAEIAACLIQLFFINKEFKILDVLFRCLIYIAIGLVMFIVVRFVALLKINMIVKLFFEIICGGLVFILLTLLYWKVSKRNLFDINLSRFLIKKNIYKNREVIK